MKTVTSLHFSLLLSLSASSLFAQTSSQTETEILVGQAIYGTLTSGTIHTYMLELATDHFVYGFVNQTSVDVVVTIYNPEGDKTAQFDGPALEKSPFSLRPKPGGFTVLKCLLLKRMKATTLSWYL
jgi:hypothetical protein